LRGELRCRRPAVNPTHMHKGRGRVGVRRATSVRHAGHTQTELGPTEPCSDCSRFITSSGHERGEYY